MPSGCARRPLTFVCGALVALLLAVAAGCEHRTAPVGTDAATARDVVVRVPVALRVARGLDELSVELDPDARGTMTVAVSPHSELGVAYTTRVFERGGTRVESERHGVVPGAGFDLGALVWHAGQDGLPQRGRKYTVEMRLVLFETDVAPGPGWNPHAGHFRPLFTRTLRQAEE